MKIPSTAVNGMIELDIQVRAAATAGLMADEKADDKYKHVFSFLLSIQYTLSASCSLRAEGVVSGVPPWPRLSRMAQLAPSVKA